MGIQDMENPHYLLTLPACIVGVGKSNINCSLDNYILISGMTHSTGNDLITADSLYLYRTFP